MLSAIALALVFTQSSPAPAVSTTSYLQGLSFFLDNVEPGVIIGPVSFAFAPAGTFTPKIVVSQNGKQLQEIGFQREMTRGVRLQQFVRASQARSCWAPKTVNELSSTSWITNWQVGSQ
jgi:hypothetical protein